MVKDPTDENSSSNINGTKHKRKRGRPKKKPKELPKFNNDSEIRSYLIEEGLLLTLELIELATKKNNIKNPTVTRAKTQQYKTALEGLKVVDGLLKNKQYDEIEEKLQLIEEGIKSTYLNEDNAEEPSEDVLATLRSLNDVHDELKSLKESD